MLWEALHLSESWLDCSARSLGVFDYSHATSLCSKCGDGYFMKSLEECDDGSSPNWGCRSCIWDQNYTCFADEYDFS